MTKPIFVVGIPKDSGLDVNRVDKECKRRMPGYYVLPVIAQYNNWYFQVFNGEGIEEQGMEELKTYLKSIIT